MLLSPVSTPRPWGPWGATIGWTVLCIVAIIAGQVVAFLIFLRGQVGHESQREVR